jgi:16S rRNA (adenine1518-N6/adenine1519-N6)-dimethyltransferase
MIKKKSLGQHFLHSKQIISDIVLAGGVSKTDRVLEIGPGEGVLTEALLATGAYVICVEKDDRLIPMLQKKFEGEIISKQLELIHADILEFGMSKVPFDSDADYKVVANIPYYITGQIIRMFLENENQPKSMTLLVQKEVAERIVARDGKESLLSLSVKAYGEPKLVRTVGKGAFTPPPTVDSAVLTIENISKQNFTEASPRLNGNGDRIFPDVGHRGNEDGSGVGEKLFFEVLHAGFAHKRKQLLPNLASIFKKEDIEKAFGECGIDLKARAEDLPLQTWLKLCNILKE